MIQSQMVDIKDVGSLSCNIDEHLYSLLKTLKLDKPNKLTRNDVDHLATGFSRTLTKPASLYGDNISRVMFYVSWASDQYASLRDGMPLPNQGEYGGWYNFKISIVAKVEGYHTYEDEFNYDVVVMSIHECEQTYDSDFTQKMFDGCLEFVNSI